MSGTTERGAETAPLRLFAFHHAGGSRALYQGWAGRLPAGWELRTPDAPGHGTLFGQPLVDDLDRLVDHFLERIGPELTEPYALFGHSMGGMVACALTHRLVDEGRTPPVWLGVSATRLPGTPPLTGPRHTLDDQQLRDYIRDMGGTPREVLDDPDMWELFAPLIRADFRVVDAPRPKYERPLPVPLSAFGGRFDASLPPERLTGWAGECEEFLGLRLFDGGHFYLSTEPGPGPLVEQVVKDLRTVLERRLNR